MDIRAAVGGHAAPLKSHFLLFALYPVSRFPHPSRLMLICSTRVSVLKLHLFGVVSRSWFQSAASCSTVHLLVARVSKPTKVALDKAIDEQISQCPPDTPMTDIHEAAFRSTFGAEYYGRCRGMGTGVTAIQVYPELSRRSQSTTTRQRSSNESEEIANLKSQMANMQTTMDFLVNAISRQGGRDDGSGTSGEPGIHLYPDQFVRMMSLIRGRRSSNNETTSNDTPQTNHSTRASFGEGDPGENGGGIA